ncbi:hypothetical protein ACF0H5_023284 [Mactra antiquata]
MEKPATEPEPEPSESFIPDKTKDTEPTRSSRKRLYIIIGVVFTIIVAIVIIVVVVVVVTQTKSKEGSNSKDSSWNPDHPCGLYIPEGVNMSDLGGPTLISGRHTCDIKGTCWKKEQCYPCLEGPNADRVGNLNHMPVCCPDCIRNGLKLSWDSCDCKGI